MFLRIYLVSSLVSSQVCNIELKQIKWKPIYLFIFLLLSSGSVSVLCLPLCRRSPPSSIPIYCSCHSVPMFLFSWQYRNSMSLKSTLLSLGDTCKFPLWALDYRLFFPVAFFHSTTLHREHYENRFYCPRCCGSLPPPPVFKCMSACTVHLLECTGSQTNDHWGQTQWSCLRSHCRQGC